MTQADVKKFLPSRMLQSRGKNLPGMIRMVNESIDKLEQLVQACIDQLYLQTASGRFLVQLGEQEGFVMPANSGLDIRSYKILVPIMVSNPKQVRNTFQDLIEAFYNRDRTRPSITSTVAGPYVLQSGEDIILETENGTLNISITSDQVSDLSNVTAAEIAAVINASQNIVFADQVADRTTNLNYLRFSSTSSGTSAFIRVAGGKLQNLLKFNATIDTLNATGTVWNLTKTSIYNDQLRFTWNGVGTNPEVYLAKKGDVITIRGFVDGAQPYSLLNGSFEAIDVGYDYFIVRNGRYTALTSSVTQIADSNIVFTKNKRISIYDNNEFAITSETTKNTITLTVPAVPPLARRFLEGSSHLHGGATEVLDFTRTTIKVGLPTGVDKPNALNHFLLSNSVNRIDFRHLYYHTTAVDVSATTPTYTIETNDPKYATLPYTVATGLGTDPFFGSVGSEDIIVNFPFRHGLEASWGMTIAGSTAGSNILTTDLNKEHKVAKVVKNNQLVIRVRDSSGDYKKFAGFNFGPCDVYQYASQQANGADFYLQFSSSAAAQASGIIPNTRFKFDVASGTNVNNYIASVLKFSTLNALEISNNRIDFFSGYGVGGAGLIISNVTGKRSGFFGGSSVTHYFDKTSSGNMDRVFNNLRASFIGYTKSVNPAFVGSFLYDPSGEKTTVTVSKYLVRLTNSILRGANVGSLEVDTTLTADGEEFPQSGEIVLDYGTDQFEGPIRYYAVITNPGSNQILIDPAYKFKKSHAALASVQKIYTTQPFRPDTSGLDLPIYLTGTTTARETLFALADLLVAAGVFVEKDVVLPDLRYQDPAIQVFE